MYELQDMGEARAKQVLQDLLTELSDIPVTELTTFEANLIRRVAKNPPADLPTVGVEGR